MHLMGRQERAGEGDQTSGRLDGKEQLDGKRRLDGERAARLDEAGRRESA